MNLPAEVARDLAAGNGTFLQDVLDGLSGERKTLPCKYFYDEVGSRLFEEICCLRDYYPTRVEAGIFQQRAGEMAALIGAQAVIVEPGAGNCEKVERLLPHLDAPAALLPIDISAEILLEAGERIRRRLPQLSVQPTVADFTRPSQWPPLPRQTDGRRVIFFPGSTIGNFEPAAAAALLREFCTCLEPGDGLLIGTDLVKDSVVLERAYADSEHLTEAFNKNLLQRINAELGADFDLDQFAHRAFYHPHRQRVEMHLVSLVGQTVHVGGRAFHFEEGETIHTENSHKYTPAGFRKMLAEAGFQPQACWTDEREYYAIHYAQVV